MTVSRSCDRAQELKLIRNLSAKAWSHAITRLVSPYAEALDMVIGETWCIYLSEISYLLTFDMVLTMA